MTNTYGSVCSVGSLYRKESERRAAFRQRLMLNNIPQRKVSKSITKILQCNRNSCSSRHSTP
jgi:hypothetical protein